jgi:PPOX class probable F420-dependent enzyme
MEEPAMTMTAIPAGATLDDRATGAPTTSSAAPASASAGSLEAARFIALTTFRRSGQPVSTPVQFVVDGDRLLVRTAHDAGKLKRIAHTSTVVVAACDSRGRATGPTLAGRATILGPDAVEPMLARLHARHRIAGPLFSAIRRLRGQHNVIIEILIEAGPAAGSPEDVAQGSARGAVRVPAPAGRSATAPHASMLPGTIVAGVLTAAMILAGCGSGGVSTGASSDGAPAAAAVPDDASGADLVGGPAGTADALAGLVAPADVAAALGSTPTPECTASTLPVAVSCVWKADDGSWLKVEDSTPAEMPDLASFTERVTDTLGLHDPVSGLGEAGFLGSSPRGTRVAIYLGDGRVSWVVLNSVGDAAAQQALVRRIAAALVAGL